MPRALRITGAAMSPVPDGDVGDVGFVTVGNGAGAGAGGAALWDRAIRGVGATIPDGGKYAAWGVVPGVIEAAPSVVAPPVEETALVPTDAPLTAEPPVEDPRVATAPTVRAVTVNSPRIRTRSPPAVLFVSHTAYIREDVSDVTYT